MIPSDQSDKPSKVAKLQHHITLPPKRCIYKMIKTGMIKSGMPVDEAKACEWEKYEDRKTNQTGPTKNDDSKIS